jgi:hypothetical protein
MKRALNKDIPKSSSEDDQLIHGGNHDTLEEKLNRTRERNREHARRTRIRKKEMIENMKMRLLELQREVQYCFSTLFLSFLTCFFSLSPFVSLPCVFTDRLFVLNKSLKRIIQQIFF